MNDSRSVDQIRANLDQVREATRRSLERVQRDLRPSSLFQESVRRWPLPWLGFAAALGFGLGLVRRGSQSDEATRD
jgi:hypothetical protein